MADSRSATVVIPAQAEIQSASRAARQIKRLHWIPNCAGMALIEQSVGRIYVHLYGTELALG